MKTYGLGSDMILKGKYEALTRGFLNTIFW